MLLLLLLFNRVFFFVYQHLLSRKGSEPGYQLLYRTGGTDGHSYLTREKILVLVRQPQSNLNQQPQHYKPANQFFFFLNLSQLFLLFTLHKLIYYLLVLYTLFFCGEYGTGFGGRKTKIGTPSLSILPGSYLTFFFLSVCLFVYKDWIWGREDGVGSLCDILRTFFFASPLFSCKSRKGQSDPPFVVGFVLVVGGF